MPTSLSRALTMNHARHRIWVDYEPNAVIKMASPGDGQPLAEQLRAELAGVDAVAHAQSGAAASELAGEASEVHALITETRALDEQEAGDRALARVYVYGAVPGRAPSAQYAVRIQPAGAPAWQVRA